MIGPNSKARWSAKRLHVPVLTVLRTCLVNWKHCLTTPNTRALSMYSDSHELTPSSTARECIPSRQAVMLQVTGPFGAPAQKAPGPTRSGLLQ